MAQYIWHDTTKYPLDLFKQLLENRDLQLKTTSLDINKIINETEVSDALKELAVENYENAKPLEELIKTSFIYDDAVSLENLKDTSLKKTVLLRKELIDIIMKPETTYGLGRHTSNKNAYVYFKVVNKVKYCTIF